jgi:hypothetical protein
MADHVKVSQIVTRGPLLLWCLRSTGRRDYRVFIRQAVLTNLYVFEVRIL